MRVTQMTSPSSGRPVPNQFVINDGLWEYFQSYQTIIAMRDHNGQVWLDEDDWNYSRTTGKYRNEYLRENTSETKRKIKEGIYKLKKLN